MLPLYPFNDWVDANTIFTVGKSILRGLVPYRDLIDQKGPLLFFLHTLGALVSFDGFFGVYLLELPVCFAFLLYQYRLLRLFYPGWFLVFLYAAIRDRKLPQLGRDLGWIALGVLLSDLPYVLYFGCHHAIGHWFQVYFYNNLVIYPQMSPMGTGGALQNLLLTLRWGLLSPLWTLTGLAFCLGTLLLALGVFAGGWFLDYYRLIFWAVYPFGFAFFYQLLSVPAAALLQKLRRPPSQDPKARRRGPSPLLPALATAVLAGALALRLSGNVYLMSFDRSQLPPYQVKAVLDASGIEHPTLLNYGFLDGGFYTVAGIVPNCRYFCYLNVGLPEIMEEQDRCIAEGRVDFVVTRTVHPDFPGYEMVGAYSFWFEGKDRAYYLYQKL